MLFDSISLTMIVQKISIKLVSQMNIHRSLLNEQGNFAENFIIPPKYGITVSQNRIKVCGLANEKAPRTPQCWPPTTSFPGSSLSSYPISYRVVHIMLTIFTIMLILYAQKVLLLCSKSPTIMLKMFRRKISKGTRTIMLQIYVGSARDLSAKKKKNNTKNARLILRKKVDFARHQHDRNR